MKRKCVFAGYSAAGEVLNCDIYMVAARAAVDLRADKIMFLTLPSTQVYGHIFYSNHMVKSANGGGGVRVWGRGGGGPALHPQDEGLLIVTTMPKQN